MRNQQQLQQDQEAMVPMDSQENSNLETTHHHHHSKKKSNLEATHNLYHVMAQMGCQENPNLETTHHHHVKKSNLETTHNHHHVMAQMGCQENPNLETTHNHHHVMAQMGCQENPNLEATTTSNHHYHHAPPSPSSSSQDFKRTHMSHVVKKSNEDEVFISKNAYDQGIKKPNCNVSCSGDMTTPPLPQQEESGRERLKRHRVEMGGRVWIPDIWGHEDLLKDWIDCTVFDSSLGNNSIMSARAALVQEGRSTLRIENRCN